MKNLPKLVLRFPIWWYLDVPRWFLRTALNLVIYLDRQLAVSLMIRLWLTPLFGDPNLIGHAIALVFRTIRIVLGLVVVILVEALFLSLFLAWLALPFLLLTRFFWLPLVFVPALFVSYLNFYADLPARLLLSEADLSLDPFLFMRPSLRSVVVGNGEVGLELLGKLLSRRVPEKFLLKLGFVSVAEFLKAMGAKAEKIKNMPLSLLLKEAQSQAWELKSQKISSIHLILAFLKRMDFKFEDFAEVSVWNNEEYDREHPPAFWQSRYRTSGLGGFNRSWTGRVTYNLDRYSRDLTRQAQAGLLPPLIGKEKPLQEAVRILQKRSKNHLLLVGAPGCGKTTLVYGLAQEIVKGTANPALADKRLVMLDLSKMQAGAKTTGELQERIHAVLDDIESSGNIILFIDEIHNAVVGGGGTETSVIFGAFVQRIEAGRFQIIGSTSWENYRKYIEPNTAFMRLFERVEISEAENLETLKILEYVSRDLELTDKVVVTLPALRETIELSRRYIYDRVLPDKAVDLLEETSSAVQNSGRQPALVLKGDVQRLVSEKTNVPISEADEAESVKLLNLEERIHARLVNQSEAVTAVADAIRRARTGLRDEKRPITSLLFVGPTGVGKTETAKALAEVFYGSEERMIRFDMSEFQTEASVESLIAKLTDAVFHKPFSLILFDEAEKANPRILDIFLQVVDDARLTDAAGHTISLANCLLTFTSNAGTNFIYESLRQGRAIEDFKKELLKKLEESFRIEFLNRFDGIIVYKPLTPEQTEMIARFKLKKITAEMEKKEYKINFSEELVKKVAEFGYDAALGARPMRRLIQDKVEATLAKKILSGEIKKGESFVVNESFLAV